MPNPFKELKEKTQKKILDQAGFEEVGGLMVCQTTGCAEHATKGMYSSQARVLMYTCPEGHVTTMEKFDA